MPGLARQYTEMWIISEVFHLQTPPRPAMHSGVGWGCCSCVPEAVLAASGTKTRYFLCFPILSPLSRRRRCALNAGTDLLKEDSNPTREASCRRCTALCASTLPTALLMALLMSASFAGGTPTATDPPVSIHLDAQPRTGTCEWRVGGSHLGRFSRSPRRMKTYVGADDMASST
jgi:hypothetical protein